MVQPEEGGGYLKFIMLRKTFTSPRQFLKHKRFQREANLTSTGKTDGTTRRGVVGGQAPCRMKPYHNILKPWSSWTGFEREPGSP